MGCIPSRKNSVQLAEIKDEQVVSVPKTVVSASKQIKEEVKKQIIVKEEPVKSESSPVSKKKYSDNNTIKENFELERELMTEFGEKNFKVSDMKIKEEEKEMLVEKLNQNELFRELSPVILSLFN